MKLFSLVIRKKLPIVVVHNVCLSVYPSAVRLSSVEITSFHGNVISNNPIDLKFGLNVTCMSERRDFSKF